MAILLQYNAATSHTLTHLEASTQLKEVSAGSQVQSAPTLFRAIFLFCVRMLGIQSLGIVQDAL